LLCSRSAPGEAAIPTQVEAPELHADKAVEEVEDDEPSRNDFLNPDTPWTCLEGKIMKIAAGDVNHIWSLSPPFGAVWMWTWHNMNGSPCVNLEGTKGRWHFIPGEELQAVDVSVDGTVWGLTKDGRSGPFRWTVSGWRGEWDFMELKDESNRMCGLTCGNKDNIWAFNQSGLPFQFDGKSWRICSPPASGNVVGIQCGADGDTWAIDADGQPYRYDEDFDWLKMGEMKVKKIAVGNCARVYAIAGVKNFVWQWKKEEERWAHILSPCPFIEIAAGHDGSVWAVDVHHKMWWLFD